jgi:hypothetical protein
MTRPTETPLTIYQHLRYYKEKCLPGMNRLITNSTIERDTELTFMTLTQKMTIGSATLLLGLHQESGKLRSMERRLLSGEIPGPLTDSPGHPSQGENGRRRRTNFGVNRKMNQTLMESLLYYRITTLPSPINIPGTNWRNPIPTLVNRYQASGRGY